MRADCGGSGVGATAANAAEVAAKTDRTAMDADRTGRVVVEGEAAGGEKWCVTLVTQRLLV